MVSREAGYWAHKMLALMASEKINSKTEKIISVDEVPQGLPNQQNRPVIDAAVAPLGTEQ